MKNSDTPHYRRGTTRRSFMKKSVVAAVAASNLTMFSGLVNAQGQPISHAPDCNNYATNAKPQNYAFKKPNGETFVKAVFVYYCSRTGIIPCNPQDGSAVTTICGKRYVRIPDSSYWAADENGERLVTLAYTVCNDEYGSTRCAVV